MLVIEHTHCRALSANDNAPPYVWRRLLVRVECGNDFRVRWTEDAEAAGSTNDLLLGLKKSAGLGALERPTTRQVEELIDELLCRAEGDRPVVHLLQNTNTWEDRISAA